MTYDIEIVLRECAHAVTEHVEHYGNDTIEWNEQDVETVLKSMLLAIDRVKHPQVEQRHVALRGFSWIVEPTPGGVVIAIEIQSGAAVAGPFSIAQPELDRLIARVLSTAAAAASARPVVH